MEYYSSQGNTAVQSATSLSKNFVDALRRHCISEPIVHHLLDNSSHPAGERFFIQRVRSSVRYFGFDPDISPRECNFVRAHDFWSLLTENFASERLAQLVEGKSVYDLPPVAVFDQKLALALPFWDETRAHFPDDVRLLFPYTTMVTPAGVRLSGGEWATIEQFAAMPRKARDYFLKYAGSDVSRNWGSRAVFHLGKLSGKACEAYLYEALKRYSAGERWIIQEQVPSSERVTFINRRGVPETTMAHSKHSVFYGPTGPLGVLVMFERFYKVHGSSETITSVGVPDKSGVAYDPENRSRLS
ncbi:hypothetical protein [Microvirga massiliensis]|uniref:hypothetical protein n=1 Tax=Microvirga massiliensis TaxID=1033741 RepID=UPI00065FCDB5|nr:hypothetical protein [Microvirga massiliensis]